MFGEFMGQGEQLEPARTQLLDAILTDFRKSFPDLQFEFRLDSKVINAKAIVLAGKCCVFIYGGLALNPNLGEDSLTFILLHETGHHLAEGARLPFNLMLACDCVSDLWAAGEGAHILERESGRKLKIENALSELDGLMSARQGSKLDYPESCVTGSCWSRHWASRRGSLETRQRLLPIDVCSFVGMS